MNHERLEVAGRECKIEPCRIIGFRIVTTTLPFMYLSEDGSRWVPTYSDLWKCLPTEAEAVEFIRSLSPPTAEDDSILIQNEDHPLEELELPNAKQWLNDWLWKTDYRETYDGPLIPEIKQVMVLAVEAAFKSVPDDTLEQDYDELARQLAAEQGQCGAALNDAATLRRQVATLTTELHRVRPFADCYERIRTTLVNDDLTLGVLGVISKLKSQVATLTASAELRLKCFNEATAELRQAREASMDTRVKLAAALGLVNCDAPVLIEAVKGLTADKVRLEGELKGFADDYQAFRRLINQQLDAIGVQDFPEREDRTALRMDALTAELQQARVDQVKSNIALADYDVTCSMFGINRECLLSTMKNLQSQLTRLTADKLRLEGELATAVRQRDSLKACYDQRNRHELEPNLPDCECPVCNVHRKLTTALATIATLEAKGPKVILGSERQNINGPRLLIERRNGIDKPVLLSGFVCLIAEPGSVYLDYGIPQFPEQANQKGE